MTAPQDLQAKFPRGARRWAKQLIEERAGALGIMIGLILDRPINLMGHDGWSIIKHMVTGKGI